MYHCEKLNFESQKESFKDLSSGPSPQQEQLGRGMLRSSSSGRYLFGLSLLGSDCFSSWPPGPGLGRGLS